MSTEGTIVIRPLVADAAAAYQALRLRALAECPTAFSSSVEDERERTPAQVLERIGATERQRMFGAFDGDGLIGVVGIVRERAKKLAHKAFIWGMYVDPARRGTGIGRRLLVTAIEFARRDLGVRQVNLGVNARNASAIGLYLSLGFESYGIERDALMVDDVLEDELLMVLELE